MPSLPSRLHESLRKGIIIVPATRRPRLSALLEFLRSSSKTRSAFNSSVEAIADVEAIDTITRYLLDWPDTDRRAMSAGTPSMGIAGLRRPVGEY